MPTKPILIILHQETSRPGRVGTILNALGFDLDIRLPVMGDALPDHLDDHDGVVVFGGPMSVNDKDAYMRRETDWLSIPLREEKPLFGICLGAQMLVRHLGGTVAPHKDGLVEMGWYPMKPTKAGKAIMTWPEMVYQFHIEGFSLPNDCELLASGETYPNQAFRYGANAWGVQFHAELTRIMMQRWIVKGAERFEMPGAQTGHQHLDGRLLYDAALHDWLKDFLKMVFVRRSQ